MSLKEGTSFKWDEKSLVTRMKMREHDQYGVVFIKPVIIKNHYGKETIEYQASMVRYNGLHKMVHFEDIARASTDKLAWLAAKERITKLVSFKALDFVKIVRRFYFGSTEDMEDSVMGYAVPPSWMSYDMEGRERGVNND